MLKNLWEDYKDLAKHNFKFMKDHKVAIAALNGIIIAAEVVYYAYECHKMNEEHEERMKQFKEFEDKWNETFRMEA